MQNGQFGGGGFPPPGGQPGQPGQFPSQQPQQPFAPQQPAPPAAPMAPAAPGGGAFTVELDADPAWEPIEQTDFLEQDGLYACKITNEKVRDDGNKAAGVFLTLQIQDEDAKGKTISKFMIDPKASEKDVRFVWRLLWLSLTGSKEQAKSGIRYSPGSITGQMVYVKTKADMNSSSGRQLTNVETFVTKDEYEAAVKENRHRWKAQVAQAPTGLPGGFPAPGGGAGFPGLPGGGAGFPGLPGVGAAGPSAPAPGGAPVQGFPPPQAQQAPPQHPQGQPQGQPQPAPQPQPQQQAQQPPAAPQPQQGQPFPGGFPQPQ